MHVMFSSRTIGKSWWKFRLRLVAIMRAVQRLAPVHAAPPQPVGVIWRRPARVTKWPSPAAQRVRSLRQNGKQDAAPMDYG